MPENNNQLLLKKIIIYFLGLLIPTFLSIYLAIWLPGLNIKYYRIDSLQVSKGISNVISDSELKVDINKVIYKNNEYESLHIVRFVIINNDWQHLGKEAKFFFIIDNKFEKLSTQHIVDIIFNSSTPSGDIIHVKREDNTDIGTGFVLESDFPRNAELRITLLLNTPSLTNIDKNIQIRKLARGNERLSLISDPSSTMVSMKFSKLIIWWICTAILYSAAWLLVNIFTRNYSTGAKITDWILRKLIGKGFIPR